MKDMGCIIGESRIIICYVYHVASGSAVTLCIKIDQPQVVYIFGNFIIMAVTMSRIYMTFYCNKRDLTLFYCYIYICENATLQYFFCCYKVLDKKYLLKLDYVS